MTPYSTSSWRTRSGLAPGLSILFTATTIGTLAALAWLIASMVCGMTPSSEATTKHDDVGHLGTAGAHGREGLVAGGVDEGDLAIADAHDRGADVLGDAAGLALGRHAGVADGVEQRRLAVVDVAHDGDDGRTRLAGPHR